MNSKIIVGLTSFIFGAGIGGTASYIYFKKQYNDKIKQDSENYIKELNRLNGTEITSVIIDETTEEKEPSEINFDNDSIMDYYKNQTNEYTPVIIKDETDIKEHPYIINPEEFGEFHDYSTIFLTYYTDGVLADMDDVVIEPNDIEEIIGSDFTSHIGEYADSLLHIRNDKLKSDYEIAEAVVPFHQKESGEPKITVGS